MAKYAPAQVKALADLMNHAKGQGKPFAMLTGSGCSVAASIPTAQGILEAINNSRLGETVRQKLGVEDVAKAPYGKAMAKLNAEERKDIIGPFLKEPKVNWGHIALAQLMQEGFIGRVLTFNFDSILARACGLIGLYPAIYDFSVVPDHKGQFGFIAEKSIIHLHGQGTSMVMMNSEKETEEHSKRLEPLFRDTLNQFNLMVMGYSGEADGAFAKLNACFEGNRRIFWCGRAEKQAPDHVQSLIDKCGDMAEFWAGVDFDAFMVELAQELGLFPPTVFREPAQHLLEELKPVMEAPEDIKGAAGLLESTRAKLEIWKTRTSQRASKRRTLMLQRKWQEAIDLGRVVPGDTEDRENLAWAFVMRAGELSAQAKFGRAFSYYKSALSTKPDLYQALNDWASDLSDLAREKEDEQLFNEAFVKYEAAIKIKPDNHVALSNWGSDLSILASLKQDASLFEEAFAKFDAATKIKADDHEAFNNWGNALGALARITDNKKRKEFLLRAALDKYEKTIDIASEVDLTLNNWANILCDLAVITKDENLFMSAFEKYEAALRANQDNYKPLTDWTTNLLQLYAISKNPALLDEAVVKGEQAERIGNLPIYDLACAYALQEKEDACRVQLFKCKEAGTLPEKAHIEKDDDLASYRDRDWFKGLIVDVS